MTRQNEEFSNICALGPEKIKPGQESSVAPSHSWKSFLHVQGLSKSDLMRVQGVSKSDLSKEGKGPITLWVHLEIQQPWGHWDIPRWTTVRVILFKHFGPCHLATFPAGET